jgi:Fic family protein
MRRPLLYLSAFFSEYRDQYYERLQAVRDDGDVEGWMMFFLTAVWRVAEAAAKTVHRILAIRESHRQTIQDSLPRSGYGVQLLDILFQRPYVTAKMVADRLEVSAPTANKLISALESGGILDEVTGQSRNRRFRYTPYLDIMSEGLDIAVDVEASGASGGAAT